MERDELDQWSVIARPQTLDDLYGCQQLKDYVENGAKTDKWKRAILLTGKFGTGKSTAARIIAMTMVCQHKDEKGRPCLQCPDCKSVIDGRFNRDIKQQGADALKKSDLGADSLKEAVKKYVSDAMKPPFFGSKRKVIIFDEIQELLASKGTINSFLTALEKEDCKTYWIFTSMEKLPESGFSSRLLKFNFNEQANNDIVRYLYTFSQRLPYEGSTLWNYLVPNAGKEFVTQGFLQIAKSCGGNLRTATNMLQECVETKTFDPRKIATRFGSFIEEDIMAAFYALAYNKKEDVVIDTLAQIDNQNQQQFVFFSASYIKDAEMARTFGKLRKLQTLKNKDTGEEEQVMQTFTKGDWQYDKAEQLASAPNYNKLRDLITKYCGIGYICKDLMIAELLSVLN